MKSFRTLHSRVLLVAAMFLPGFALAQQCTAPANPCSGSGTASQASPNGPTAAGNPIDFTNGNKHQHEIDLAWSGPLALEFSRHYNSLGTQSREFGSGWTHSYETRLTRVVRNDAKGNAKVSIQLRQADGREIRFEPVGAVANGVLRYLSVPRGYGFVVENVAVVERLRRAQSNSLPAAGDDPTALQPWQWQWLDGRKLSFDARGLTRRIENADGDFLALDYDQDTRLVRIRDALARTARFEYWDDAQERLTAFGVGKAETRNDQPLGSRGRLKSLTGPEGQSLRYGYDSAGMLSGVWYDDGTVRRYEYVVAAGAQRLARIIGRDGKLVGEYGYDEYGRAVSTSGADGVGKIELKYQLARRRGEPNATWLRNSAGEVSVYRWTFEIGASESRIVEAVGPGCQHCAPSNLRYGYDARGRITSVEKLAPVDPRVQRAGRVLARYSTRYDDFGRVVETRREDTAKGGELIQRREYATDFGTPTLIARPSVVAGREHVVETELNARGQPLRISERGFDLQDGAAIERTTRFAYTSINGRSRLTSVDGPLPNGRTATPADSDIVSYEYDSQGALIVKVTQPMNLSSRMSYDALGRMLTLTGPAGLTDTYSYLRGQQLAAVKSSATLGIAYGYDRDGHIIETTRLVGDERRPLQRFGYDAQGRFSWEATALGVLRSVTYDSESRLLSSSVQSRSMVSREQYRYDSLGRLTEVLDDTGARQFVMYNRDGGIAGLVDPLGGLTEIGYSDRGDPTSTWQAGGTDAGMLVTYGRDATGSLDRINAWNGRELETEAAAQRTSFVRDDFGRVVRITNPDSGTQQRRFDAAGRLVRMADEKGIADYEYDAAGRIVRQSVRAVDSDKARVTRWTYSGTLLIALDDEVQSERYGYDEQGRRTERIVLLHSAEQGGKTLRSVTRYEYDALGELFSISLPDGSLLEYERNGQGQIVALQRHRIHTRWLRWMLPGETIVSEVDRDLIGVRHQVAGNGIESWMIRSREGVLARSVFVNRNAHATNEADAQRVLAQRAFTRMLGASDAEAAAPAAPAAILRDRHYQWDPNGNLAATQTTIEGRKVIDEFSYDGRERLTISQRRSATSPKTQVSNEADGAFRMSRWYYDNLGNRVLGQEDIVDGGDFITRTSNTKYHAANNRPLPNAQPGGPARSYHWDAFGRLVAVAEAGETGARILASFRYNHRGERVGKVAGDRVTAYFYEERRLTGELNGAGQLARQYIYIGDQPVALIDTPAGADVESDESPGIGSDIATVFGSWFGDEQRIVYLHANHLGAIEFATGAKGEVVWSADYAAFGRAHVAAGALAINLRLPGQYEDVETGLHYNDRRYYDPDGGRYLSPDPLGLAGGYNGYAYVENNPLRSIDPTGLILFAFDGTGNNSEEWNDAEDRDFTNVWHMYRLYDTSADDQQRAFYHRGIGSNPDGLIDQALANDAEDFVSEMLLTLAGYVMRLRNDPDSTIVLDVIGFSRGAAQARVFANQVIRHRDAGDYGQHCIQFRFLGLFDTVSQFGANGSQDDEFDFNISAEWQHVAQAYALNEHRALFPLRDINRGVSQGFVGAHSDIGGGYSIAAADVPGDLSDVALNWMIQQAQSAGVDFLEIPQYLREVSNPVLHDQRNTSFVYGTRYPRTQCVRGTGCFVIPPDEREVILPDGTRIRQPQYAINDPTWGPMLEGLIERPAGWDRRTDHCAGQVNMALYRAWLEQNAGVVMLPAAQEGRTQPCVRTLPAVD